MNPWNQLLESLHSSLIDELVEVQPEPKPVLELPVRKPNRIIPFPEADRVIGIQVMLDGAGEGICAIALTHTLEHEKNLKAAKLLETLIRRSHADFLRRKITPHFSDPFELKLGKPLPWGVEEPSLMVWIPIWLEKGLCCLGVGRS